VCDSDFLEKGLHKGLNFLLDPLSERCTLAHFQWNFPRVQSKIDYEAIISRQDVQTNGPRSPGKCSLEGEKVRFAPRVIRSSVLDSEWMDRFEIQKY
jgi:hypothetical protein